MPPIALALIPLFAAGAAYSSRTARTRGLWVLFGAVAHLAAVLGAWQQHAWTAAGSYIGLDDLGLLVLTLVSVVFLAVSFYIVGYGRSADPRGGRAFAPCMLLFLAAATVVCLAQHLAILWVAMEATTLATAPLIYEPGDRHSLEAVWKYLLICSVGIAIALLGTFFVAMAQMSGKGSAPVLVLHRILTNPPRVDATWFRIGVIFLVVGYGTKVGLAPMHTWLPDAHGEAPSPVSALLSGALLNCAFLAILRVVQLSHAVGQGEFTAGVLLGFGVLSVIVAVALMLRQESYKRLLAYSSVEHMGILAAGVGVGGLAGYGALLHMLGSGMVKALLFLVAGNILAEYGSKRIRDVRDMAWRMPLSAALLVLGLFALTGSPPFSTFVSEVALLRGMIAGGQAGIAVVLLALQLIAFLALASRIMSMVFDAPREERGLRPPGAAESRWLTLPPLALLALALLLGLYLPPVLHESMARGVQTLGGVAP
jgi:hydrogenase-4 component F